MSYNYKRENDVIGQRPIDSTLDYFVGEMLYVDSVSFLYKNDIDDTKAANFAGVSLDQVPVSGIGDRDADKNGIAVARKGVFKFKTTVADVYHQGALVYVGADANTVSVTGTNAIGRAQMPAVTTAITGAVGVYIDVEIVAVK